MIELSTIADSGAGLLETLNYTGTIGNGVKPTRNLVPIQAVQNELVPDATWTPMSGPSDEVVQFQSQGVPTNFSDGNNVNAVPFLNIPINHNNNLDGEFLSNSDCHVGPWLPMLHNMKCLGALAETQTQIEKQLEKNNWLWVTSWTNMQSPIPLDTSIGVVIKYSAVDDGNYGGASLSSVRLWRAKDNGKIPGGPDTWKYLPDISRDPGSTLAEGTFTDNPLEPGTYWYSVDALDSVDNHITNEARSVWFPVTFTPSASTTYTLTVNSSNPSSGMAITVSPADSDTKGNGTTPFSRTYSQNTPVTLTAPSTAPGGASFSAWTGCNDADPSGTSCKVTMSTAKAVTAHYTQGTAINYTLTANTSGNGTVSSSDGNINCGSICTHDYSVGASVTLNATPASGWSFSGWGGACTGTSPCNVTMDAEKTVIANYSTTPATSIAHLSYARVPLPSIASPHGIAVDGNGNIFVASSGPTGAIKEILSDGGYSTVNTLRDGIYYPDAVAVDPSGNVFFSEIGTGMVKELLVSTDYVTAVTLNSGSRGPNGLAVNGSGDVFVVREADSYILRLNAKGDYSTTDMLGSLRGPGPHNVAVDASGNIFFTSTGYSDVMELVMELLNADGYSTVNMLGNGLGAGPIAVDGSGNVFVARNGIVTQSLAVSNYATSNTLISGSSSDGVAVDKSGNIFISDIVGNQVVELTKGIANFGTVIVGSSSAPVRLTFAFDTDATIGSMAILTEGTNGMDATITNSNSGACAVGTYSAGSTCTLDVTFAPRFVGPRSGSLVLRDNGGYVIATAYLQGKGASNTTGTTAALSSITVSPANATILTGNTQQFVATGTYSDGSTQDLTGSVGWTSTNTGVATMDAYGVATALIAGSTSIGANLNGLSSSPASLVVSVAQATYSAPTTAVGATSATQTATIEFSIDATLGSIRVVTQGVTGLDFNPAPGGTCSVGTAYTAGQTCTVNFTFKPRVPGQRMGAIVITDGGGNDLTTTYVSGIGTGPQAAFAPGTITTVAGTGTIDTNYMNHGDGVAATSESISYPTGVAADSAGNIYFVDDWDQRVRMVSAGTGLVNTVAGGGMCCDFKGDGIPATSAWIGSPAGVALDGAGNVYVVEEYGSRVFKVNANTGLITTVAGTGVSGYNGDGIVATSATLSRPYGIALDSSGNIYIADMGAYRIRKVNASTGLISTVAGNGSLNSFDNYIDGVLATSVGLNVGLGVAVDSAGNIYITDVDYIRKVNATTGLISTVAGNGTCQYNGENIAATSAGICDAEGLAVDGTGNLYLTDYGNNRIRKVNVSTGLISTVAGNGTSGYNGDNIAATSAELNDLRLVAVDGAGNVYIADGSNQRIRRVSAGPISLSFAPTAPGSMSSDSPQTVTLWNNGNTELKFPIPSSGKNPSISTNFTLDSSSATACPMTTSTALSAGTLSAGASCALPISFVPTMTGAINGSLVLTDNNLNATNATQTLSLVVSGSSPSAPVASLSADSLTFSVQTVNTTSTTQQITLTNTGNAALAVSQITSSEAFGETNNCPATLTANANCTINVNFAPTKAGILTGQLTILDNASGSPHTVTLMGTGTDAAGTPSVNLSCPTQTTSECVRVNFGFGALDRGAATPILPPEALQSILVTNSGIADLHFGLTPFQISGQDADAFTLQKTASDACSNESPLPAGKSCSIYIAFAPTSLGLKTATLTINSDDPNGAQTIALGGSGMNVFYQFGGELLSDDDVPLCYDVVPESKSEILPKRYGVADCPNTTPTMGFTTRHHGCALSSAAAAMSTFQDVATGTPAAIDSTPPTNARCQGESDPEKKGLYCALGSGDIYFQALPHFAEGCNVHQVNGTDVMKGCSSVQPGTPLNDYLTKHIIGKGDRVVLHLCQDSECKSGSHFVTVLGPRNVNDWELFDPGWQNANLSDNSLLSQHEAGVSISSSIQRKFVVTGVRTLTNASSVSSMSISGFSPVELLVTDPNGNLIGHLGPNSDVAQADGSSYFTDYALSDDTGTDSLLGDTTGIKTVYISNPLSGTYLLTSTGTGDGNYTLTVSATDSSGNTQSAVSSGVTSLGSSTGYQVSYSPTTSIPVTITPILGPTFSPASVAFGEQTVGTISSHPQAVTVTNSGLAPLSISNISIQGQFSQTNSCGISLAAGASCTVWVTFAPTSPGTLVGILMVADNAGDSPQKVALSGTGITPTALLTPSTLTFGNQTQGSTSSPWTVNVTNNSNSILTISSVSITGTNPTSFTIQSKTCGTTLAANSSCSIYVTFTPPTAGSYSATLAVADNATGSPQTVPLSGTGTAINAFLAPSSLSFVNQAVGVASSAQQVTLDNSSNGAMAISGIGIVGTNASSFSQTNNCGTTLAGNSTCTIWVTFTPATVGTLSASLSVTDNATGSPQTIPISGNATGGTALLTPSSLTFGNQTQYSKSSPWTVNVTNNSNSALTITGMSVTGVNASYFSIQSSTCGTTLAANSSCSIYVTFAPATVGSFTATLQVADNAPGSPQTVPLTGTGTAINAFLAPSSLSFVNQSVGVTSSAQLVTLDNSSNGAMTISSVGIVGANASSFSQTNNCGTTLAGNSTCTIWVTFTPAAAGTLQATLSVADNAAGSPQSIPISGNASGAAALLTPSTLTFGNQTQGSTSSPWTVNVTNNSNSILTISSVSITGTNPTSFAIQSKTCGTTLAANSSCSIYVTFTPPTAGSYSATLAVADNATGSPQTVPLSGTGTAINAFLAPSSLSFVNQAVGVASSSQQVTLDNSSNGAMAISGIGIVGTNASSFSQTNNCGTTLAGNSTCTIWVTFTPATAGTLSASLSVTDNATGSPQTIPITGNATPGPQTIAFVQPASPVTYGISPITLSATATSGLAVSFGIVSGPGSISGTTLTITGAGTVVVAANQAGNANYSAATQVTRTLVVGKGTPSISAWPTASAITFGQTLALSTLNGGSAAYNNLPLAGVFTWDSPSTVPPVGTNTYWANFTPADIADYNTASNTVIIRVIPVTVASISTANLGANQVTLVVTSSASGTGYLTVLSVSSATCGTAEQTMLGEDSTGTVTRHGLLPLTANAPGNYTMRNLMESTTYKVCFTPDGLTAPSSTTFTTTAMRDLSASAWVAVGSTGFSPSEADFSSLAFAPDGSPYVAYADNNQSYKATVMKYDGASWVTMGSPGFSAGQAAYTPLAFAPDGTPYVAFEDYGNSYKTTVMRYNGSSWIAVGSEGFSAGPVTYVSLALAPDGAPYVAYSDLGNSAKATVMRYNGSSWVTVGSAGFSTGEAASQSLAFAPDGTPYVAFEDNSSSGKATVMKYNGSSWITVGSAGLSAGEANYVSLVIAPDGVPYVGYMDYGNSYKATVMKYNGSLWVTVGSGGFSDGPTGFTSLAIAPDGTPYFAFNNISGKATVMKYNGSSWVAVGMSGFSSGNLDYKSLAFAPDGTPYLAYRECCSSFKATVMKFAGANAATSAPTNITSTSATLNGMV